MKHRILEEVLGVTAHLISDYALGNGFLDLAVVEMAAAKRQGAPPSSRSRRQAMSISEADLSDVKLAGKVLIP
ncbi:MAG: hypothetical protein H8K07_18125 [Nitrospira sp.]|nr:hypothetical protein [Nitrospira sp.]